MNISGEHDHPVLCCLETFAQWIALQPASIHAGLLDCIANDLYRRRNYQTLAGEIKYAARDLRALSRHGEEGR